MRGVGIENLKNNNEHFIKAAAITDILIKNAKQRVCYKDYHCLQYAKFLCLSRSEKLSILIPTINYLKTGIIFNTITSLFSRNNIELHENDIAFISFVFKNISLNPESNQLIELDYQYYRNRLIKSFPEVIELIMKFESTFNR